MSRMLVEAIGPELDELAGEGGAVDDLDGTVNEL
jgi:hypothetical protein